MAVPKCSSCGKALEEGWLQDHGHGANYTTAWVAGAPEKSFVGGAKVRGRQRLRVFALRCPSCGLLHLYAPGAPPVV
jgi:hypothetical protein